MKNSKREVKTETVIFRASPDKVNQIDYLAKLIGTNRSEALRRIIPDFTGQTNKNAVAKCG